MKTKRDKGKAQSMMARILKQVGFIVFTLLIVIVFSSSQNCRKVALNQESIEVPYERTIHWNEVSPFQDSIVAIWAKKPIRDGKKGGKVSNPRILLARLHSGTKIKETNENIMNMTPWGVSGSTWSLNKKGDYDFSLTVFTTILWQFGNKPDVLYQETVDHLLNVLLIEEGKKFSYTTPRTFGLISETENHLLMTEGSRYLKNRWLAMHGSDHPKHDNDKNKMERRILELLYELKTNGLDEFNSMPYVGYTITALLNLEAYASESVRKEARNVLDYMNYCYALSSYHYQRFPPMRRRYERSKWKELTTGYHAVFMKAWMSFLPNEKTNFAIGAGQAHALMGVCMPYRPADKITELLFDKGNGYFIKLGHGRKSCPEIYSAGKHYLLSAGGANRGIKSQIVARPITLFTRNNAKVLAETFHLSGPGTNFMKWNNSGVYKNFACAAGPVSIPQGHQPIAQNKTWAIYDGGDGLSLAVFSSDNLGILAIFENQDPQKLLFGLEKENSDLEKLQTHFQFPEGSLIEYNVNAPKSKWVIVQVDNTPVARKYGHWPLINGEFEP